MLARDEMAERARAAEARLSDMLHQRLTERFVNRRTSVLLKSMGKDASLLRVELGEDGAVTVEGERIGHLEGLRFVVDQEADSDERKLMLAAAERHLPALLATRADELIAAELGVLEIARGKVMRGERELATLVPGKAVSLPRLEMGPELRALESGMRARLSEALELWLESQLAPLAPLRAIEEAALDPEAGSEVRALLLVLAERHGTVPREQAGLAVIPKEKRPFMRKLGVMIGALDVFMPALLKPAPRKMLSVIGADRRPLNPGMQAVIEGGRQVPAGYRQAGGQAIRVDMAEKLFRAAHDLRNRGAGMSGRGFAVDTALATSMGLLPENFEALMRQAGFRPGQSAPWPEALYGPPPPRPWTWRAPRKDREPIRHDKRNAPNVRPEKPHPGKDGPHGPRPAAHRPATSNAAFAGLADLLGKN